MANKPPASKKPRVKASRNWIMLSIGVLVLVVIVIVGASILFGGGKSLPNSSGSAAPVANGHEQNTDTGAKASPAYVHQVDTYNNQAAASASASGASYVPVVTPAASTASLSPTDGQSQGGQSTGSKSVVTPAGPAPSEASKPAPAPAKPDVKMVGEMRSLLRRLTPQAAHSEVFADAQASASRARAAATGAASAEGSSSEVAHSTASTGSSRASRIAKLLRPGSVLYAVEDVRLNSDAPGPAMAEVADGPLKGAKLIGKFQRHKDHLVVQFSTLSLKNGKRFSIESYAVDPHTSATSVQSWANDHTFSRWAALMGASFLQGIGQAVSMSGSVSYGTQGGTVTSTRPKLDLGQEALVAAGKVGQTGATIASQYFNRPPTVVLKAGQPIGVLIVNSSINSSK